VFCSSVIGCPQLWRMKRWEAVLGVGPSFSFPDIGGFSIGKKYLGFKDLSYRQTRFALTAP